MFSDAFYYSLGIRLSFNKLLDAFYFLWHMRLTMFKSLITEIELSTSLYIYICHIQPLFESASSTYTNVHINVFTFLVCFLQSLFESASNT